jgi:hypothetical protein
LEASPTEEEEVLRRGETILYRQNLLASCWFILVGRRYDPRERKRKKKLQQQKSQRNDIMASLSLSLSRFILRALGGSKKGLKLYTSSQTAFFIRTISFL